MELMMIGLAAYTLPFVIGIYLNMKDAR
jgi:hypothetical protein